MRTEKCNARSKNPDNPGPGHLKSTKTSLQFRENPQWIETFETVWSHWRQWNSQPNIFRCCVALHLDCQNPSKPHGIQACVLRRKIFPAQVESPGGKVLTTRRLELGHPRGPRHIEAPSSRMIEWQLKTPERLAKNKHYKQRATAPQIRFRSKVSCVRVTGVEKSQCIGNPWQLSARSKLLTVVSGLALKVPTTNHCLDRHGPTSRPKEGGPFCCDIASVTSAELRVLDWMDLSVCISKSDAHRF